MPSWFYFDLRNQELYGWWLTELAAKTTVKCPSLLVAHTCLRSAAGEVNAHVARGKDHTGHRHTGQSQLWHLAVFCISSLAHTYSWNLDFKIHPLKGGQGYLMSPSHLESQDYHLIPLFYLLSCSSAYFCCSINLVPFSAHGPLPWDVFFFSLQKFFNIFFIKRWAFLVWLLFSS